MTEERLRQALEAHRRGDLALAEEGYRAVLAQDREQADAWALLGVALEGQGKADKAFECFDRAIHLDPQAALFRIYKGNALAARKDWAGAIKAFREAEALTPQAADIPYNLGNVLREAGESEEAEKAYSRTLRLAPEHFMARNNLALVFEAQGRRDEAVDALERVVQIAPDYLDGWLNLSSLCEKNRAYDRALEAALCARDLAPEDPRGWFGIGVVYSRLNRDSDALAFYQEALRLRPEWVEGWDNLGQTFQNLNLVDEAERAFRRCVACAGQTIENEDSRAVDEKEYGSRHWHLALLELLKGDLKRGFARYRSRFHEVEGLAREPWPRPVWQGEKLDGKILLVMDEQGMGDCLMMARYLPLLKERGAKVKLHIAAPLIPLFKEWSAVDEVFAKGERISDFDFYASIFDLPYAFQTTLETIPAETPYLPLPSADAETKLEIDGLPKIGVIWAGAPLHKHDWKRSVPLEIFQTLFEEKDFRFYSFNRDKRKGDEAILSACGVTDLAPLLVDFAASARLMGQMDLIISCDTATAHLAGGLGKRVWTLLPFAPDWRWLLNREDSPWYPTMRLFRQRESGDWADVMTRVRSALASGSWRANLSANG